MKLKNILSVAFFAVASLVLSASLVSAQEMMKKEKEKPIVAVIKADWCPYCRRVDPVINSLMGDYSEKLNFVAFDVTDDAAIAESMKKAESLGLGEFFKDFKNKTSAVAVIKDGKIVYKTSNNGKREDYVKAFDEALE